MPPSHGTSQNATPVTAWRSAVGAKGTVLPREWFGRPVEVVARHLLGRILVSEVEGRQVAGRILETEAYGGPEDPASHAATRQGRTRRNSPMFGPPGTAYLYRSYGMHWCFNVVTGDDGDPQAVLVRALEPLLGLPVMEERRGPGRELTRGPGRLAAALGLHGGLNGHSLDLPPVRVLAGRPVPDTGVERSGRIGIRRAREWPLRFFLRGHPGVSSGPHLPASAMGARPS